MAAGHVRASCTRELWHIGFNMLALFWLGRMIEPALGHARFVGIYFASLFTGSLAVLLISPDTPTLGASGAVYGLLGAAIVMARNRQIDLMQSGPAADPRAELRASRSCSASRSPATSAA